MFKDQIKKLPLQIYKGALNFGLIIVPNHYYTAVPDLRYLRRTVSLWGRKSQMIGIDCDLDQQARRLKEICKPYESETRGNRIYREACKSGSGPGFGYIEAQALHAVVRYFKPKQIVEIGSGVSTRCSLSALAINKEEVRHHECLITCIEPHPRSWLRQGPVSLITEPVQTVGFEMFENLKAGSLLFVDSTHAVRTGSEVNYLILEVLPRLQPGVIVHFHDIYLPYDYSTDSLNSFMHWQETALLHAFLIGNKSARILFSLSQLHYERREVLTEVFPEYRPRPDDGNGLSKLGSPCEGHFPSSIYFEIVNDLKTG
jgi:hypothetical protein